MRIIGGQWRGRKLNGPPAQDRHIRPTSDRVRENWFNILCARFGGSLHGLVVADFCAGTGALGLEALSRGAASCQFLENNAAARALIDHNIRLVGAGNQAKILPTDVTRLPGAAAPVDLLLFDPPYAAEFVPSVMANIVQQGWAKNETILCLEQAKKADVSSPYWQLDDTRNYGSTCLQFFVRA